MSEINVPAITIPQMHGKLTTLSGTDLVPVVQGSEYDRDAAATLSEILASNPFQNQKEWKTFTLSAAALDTGTWTHNALVLLDAWESSISYSGTSIKNGIMILIPKWSAAPEGTTACTFAEIEGTTCPILRGNILLLRFGANGKVSAYFSIPASSADTIAFFKSLSVSGSLSFPAGSISEAMIANDAVTEGKIANDAVTAHKIAARAVEMGAIAVGAVTEDTIAVGAVTSDTIAVGAVTALKLSDAVKLLWRQCFSFSSSVLTPSGITSAYVACPRKLIEGFSLRIVVRSDTWSTSLQVVSIVIGGQTFTNLTSGWIYEDECYILDNVPITSSMCVDFINIRINTANFPTGQLVMSVQQFV